MDNKEEISEEEFLKHVDPLEVLDDDETWEEYSENMKRSDPDASFYKTDDVYFFQTAGFEYFWKDGKQIKENMKFKNMYFKEGNIHIETTIPANSMHGSEYGDSAIWSSFKKMSKADQIKWAKTIDLSEPIDDVHLDTDVITFSDGHHRVKAASILGKEVPVIITMSRYNKKDSLFLIDLLRSGLTLREINPEHIADRRIDLYKVKEYYDTHDKFDIYAEDGMVDKYYKFIKRI